MVRAGVRAALLLRDPARVPQGLRPLRAEQVGDDQVRQLLAGSGMGRGLVEAVLGMSTFLRGGFVREQARTPVTTTPTTLGAWAYEVLRPLLMTGSGG